MVTKTKRITEIICYIIFLAVMIYALIHAFPLHRVHAQQQSAALSYPVNAIGHQSSYGPFSATFSGLNSLFVTSYSGWYQFNCITIETVPATTSSTLPSCSILFTDSDTGVSQTITQTGIIGGASATANVVGLTIGIISSPAYVAQGTNVNIQALGYVSSGAIAMSYRVRVKTIFLGQ